MWVRDHLESLWIDEDFACWYPRDGRPGLSPAQLATVCVLQFLHNLSDRQAAEAVRCRIDFKYALAMELDDPGFHHSVLSDFRDRLAVDDRADRLLDLALERLRVAGRVKRRGRQRTDSTHVLAAARDLTRLELITEAIRAALEELARDAPHLLDGLVDEEWAKRYGRPVRLVSQPSRPATRLKQAGLDAFALLQSVGPEMTSRARPRTRQAEALRQIFLQNFLVDGPVGGHGDAVVRPRTEPDGFPPGRLRIVSPYDVEARWGCRGDKRWTGYLIHTTETCDDGRVNLVTDVATTCATRSDIQALPAIHARLKRRRMLPGQHLVDAGYTSATMLHQAARQRITLIGPLKGNGSWQHRQQPGFAREAFTIDYDRRQVTCPNGKTSGDWLAPPAQAPYLVVKFDRRLCDPCPDRGRCTRSREGRTVTFLPRSLHEHQARNRIDQQDSTWLRTYGSRSGVEGTINEFVNAHRTRDCRYRGLAKTHVQHVLTAIAVNIERLHDQQAPGGYSRPATAFQQYLVNHGHPLPRWWRQGAA
jgi:transposase